MSKKGILKRGVAAAGVVLMLAGCSETGKNEGVGTLVGAGLGAWIGSEIGGRGDSQVVGAAIGTLVGASIGNSVGRKLDERDRLAMAQTQQYAFESTPSGTSSDWYNPDSGNRGSVTPRPAYQNDAGNYCREYQQTVTVGGETVDGYGTACRQPDGSWKIVNG